MWKCRYCENEFPFESIGQKGNHTRWCEKNPKSKEDKERLKDRLINARKCIKSPGNQFTKAKREGRTIVSKVKGRPREGHPHTEETKRLLSEKALASPHRRLRRNIIEYNGVKLDSTWELELAVRLDELGIAWTRPEPLAYTMNEKSHHYFPDFYLPDRDIYLDPKNPHAFNVQREKIQVLLELYPNIRFLTSIEEIRNFS